MDATTIGEAPASPANDLPPEGQTIVEKITIPMPFVVFATPSASHWCSMPHRDAMLELRALLIHRGIPHAFVGVGGKLYLDLVRDTLASQFLREFPEATDLFFIDDDVGFPAEKVIEFLVRPEPLLVGATPYKRDNPNSSIDFPVRLLADKDSGTLLLNNGFLKVDRAPAGFMRIKRAVLDALLATGNIIRYRDPDSGHELHHFFSIGVAADDDGRFTYWGEDTIFVQRCINAGIECWLDPNITFRHSGHKTWEGNCLRELFKRGSVEAPEGIKPSLVVVGGTDTPAAANSEAIMDHQEYPKFVHGELAQDAEDESRIEREWAAANPGAPPPYQPPAEDTGIAPSEVAASSMPAPDPDVTTQDEKQAAESPVVEEPIVEAAVEADPTQASGALVSGSTAASANESAAADVAVEPAPASIEGAKTDMPAETAPVAAGEGKPGPALEQPATETPQPAPENPPSPSIPEAPAAETAEPAAPLAAEPSPDAQPAAVAPAAGEAQPDAPAAPEQGPAA